jgi:hypothetical protein
MAMIEREPTAGRNPGGRLSTGDRLRAWLVTGPIGRLVALVIDFWVALGRALLRRRS